VAIRILVVEDEPHVADVISDALASAGHECVRAHDALEAQRLLATERVDGITLDLRMPGADGLDWLSTLWSARPELARRTLVVTGTVLSPADCHRLAKCGASLIAKPFRVDELIDLLAKQLTPGRRIPFSRN
jgi:DNA-binding response OmpR family regulator